MLNPRLEMSMEPSSEPAPGHGLQVATIGGVLVTRDEIVKALAVLKGRPDTDTWILPRLIDIESPSRCAITGCDVKWAPEAAHIRRYLGPASNDVRNGLLLRADIHSLFDLDLLGINPETRKVVLSWQLTGKHYKPLSGLSIADPKKEKQRPSKARLTERWQRFQEKQQTI